MSTPVRIGFSVAKGWRGLLSRLIMVFTGGVASHCFLLRQQDDVDVVVEASNEGVRECAFAEWQLDHVLIELYLPAVPLEPALHLVTGCLGRPYDLGGLLGMTVVEAARRFLHRTVNNPLRSHRALFCSELIADAMQAVGYPGAEVLPDFDTDPMDVRRVLRDSGAQLLFPPVPTTAEPTVH